MQKFQDKVNGEVVVLGHIISIGGTPFDMRKVGWGEEVKEYCGGESWGEDSMQGYLEWVIYEVLPCETNWGNGERDWDEALQSNDNDIKMMLALNGKFLDILAQEKSPVIRSYVVEAALKEKLDDDLTANAWLGEMINDKHAVVRASFALTGKQDYLDILINDDNDDVRTAVAVHGEEKHLDVLLKDISANVRQAVAERGFSDHISVLAQDSDKFVSEAADMMIKKNNLSLARHGDLIEVISMKNSTDSEVRRILASRGFALDSFIHDSEPEVRLEVARHGFGLDSLINDKDSDVRHAAVSYPAIVELP